MFCYPENIAAQIKQLFTKLKQDRYLKTSFDQEFCTGKPHTFFRI